MCPDLKIKVVLVRKIVVNQLLGKKLVDANYQDAIAICHKVEYFLGIRFFHFSLAQFACLPDDEILKAIASGDKTAIEFDNLVMTFNSRVPD